MTAWAVGALAGGTYLIRLAGLLLRDKLKLPRRITRLFDLSATALIAALVVTAALTEGGEFAGWSRALGVVAGGVVAWRRLPLVLVVLVAAGVTAGLRLLGVP